MHLGSRSKLVPLCGLVVALGLAGCGSSGDGTHSATTQTVQTAAANPASTTTADSTATKETVPAVDISLESSVKREPLSAHYTCDGADVPPPLNWSKIPAGTAELDLFILSALPIKGKFDVAWAVAGLSPRLHGLSSDSLPTGAVMGNNSAGKAAYSLCPPKGSPGSYAVLLYALPHRIHVKQGFDAEVLVEGTLVHTANHEGEISLSYKPA